MKLKLPNRWGGGSLFAFSGMEGETDWLRPFVGRLCEDRLGVAFFEGTCQRELCFGTTGDMKGLSFDIVCSDLVEVHMDPDASERLRFLFLDRNTILGQATAAFRPKLSPGVSNGLTGEAITCSDGLGHTILITESRGGPNRFACAHDHDSRETAYRKALLAIEKDFENEYRRKITFFERLPRPTGLTEDQERTYYKAFSVLKVNAESAQGDIRYPWLTPDRLPHRSMFLWDTVFQAMACLHISPQIAENALKAVLERQTEDGFIAHRHTPYGGAVSDVTQPPLLAWGCWQAYVSGGNREFLEWAYPRLASYLGWDIANRNPNRTGLLAWRKDPDQKCRCGESGMDNSPRFDAHGDDDAIDFSSFAASDMRYMVRIAAELGLQEESGVWTEKANRLDKLVGEQLWDAQTGFFYDRSTDGRFIRIKTPASFLPMFSGSAGKQQADRLVEHLTDLCQFWLPLPIPSVAADEISFSDDMWRGPSWLNYNYLVILGLRRYGYNDLASEMAKRNIEQVCRWYCETGILHEYYDPFGETRPDRLHRKGGIGGEGGTGFGTIKDYGWSAAIYALLALEDYGQEDQPGETMHSADSPQESSGGGACR